MDFDFTNLGGRRFILTVGMGIVSTFLLWFGKLDSNAFSNIIMATVGAFIAGNTYESVKTNVTTSSSVISSGGVIGTQTTSKPADAATPVPSKPWKQGDP